MTFEKCKISTDERMASGSAFRPKPALSMSDFKMFRDYIENQAGIRLKDNKAHMLQMRLGPLMLETESQSYEALFRKISSDRSGSLTGKLVEVMTTNETHWFRDQSPFKILEEVLFPYYAERLKKGLQTKIRIWSSACSTGQEPYTIAMVYLKFIQKHAELRPDQLSIVATDISERVLEVAQKGHYDRVAMIRGMQPSYLKEYFEPVDKGQQIKNEVKQRVQFKQFNLKSSYRLIGKQDIIFCRNVLCYFDTPLKKDIVSRMFELLRPRGYLILGAIESMINYSIDYKMLRHTKGTYYQVEDKPGV